MCVEQTTDAAAEEADTIDGSDIQDHAVEQGFETTYTIEEVVQP